MNIPTNPVFNKNSADLVQMRPIQITALMIKLTWGVRQVGWTFERMGGSRRSSLNTKNIRDGTRMDPLILVKKALMAPMATMPDPQDGK